MSKLHIDQYSSLESVLHRRDPRVKIIAFFTSVLFIVITPPESFISFGMYGVFIFVLILLSKIPIGYIIKRSIIIIPFVLVIAAFTPFLKRGSVLWEYQIGSLKLAITYEGLIMLWNVLIKAYLSILCMILLMASTGFINLIKAMEGLRLPKLIVMIFSFMYRYLFVLHDELTKMKYAKESRTVGDKRWFSIKALSNMLGVLFIKSYERGESLYLAMCSRGFDGTIRTLGQDKLTRNDIFFLLLVAASLIFIMTSGYFIN